MTEKAQPQMKTRDPGRAGLGVWVLEKMKPKRIRVKTGISDGTCTEVLSGELKEGNEVIVADCRPGEETGIVSRNRRPPRMFHHGPHRDGEITKIYGVGDRAVPALDGATLTIERGEFVAIMGPLGIREIHLHEHSGVPGQAHQGQYLLDGVDIGKLDRDELAEIRSGKIGFVFQGFNLLARTSALENVELPMLYSGVPAGEEKSGPCAALQAVGLEGREHHHPEPALRRAAAAGGHCPGPGEQRPPHPGR